jgi:antitoxin component YwqK of YwqJK toxin-antitoxin module
MLPKPIPALLCLALWAGCASRSRSVAIDPGPERITEEGRTLERRVSLNYSGNPVEIFYVYRDSAGNYVEHGSHRHFYQYGQLKYVEHFRDGKLDGVSEFWYENGAKQGELPMTNGKPNGTALTWYPDGRKKSEKHWVNGQLDGPSIEWDAKGKKTSEILWSRNAVREVVYPPKR